MLRAKRSEWIEKEREKGNARLTVSTVGVLSDFCYWLESDAEQRDGADLAQQTCPTWHATGFLPRGGEVDYTCRYCDGVGQV